MNLNKAFVLGNVTKDPEVRSLPSGQQVTNFAIATNRFYTDSAGQKKEEAEFHNIVCFGKLADISSRYLTKGSLVLIEGRIKTRSWQDSSNQKHWKTEIIAEGLQLGPRGAGNSGGTPRAQFSSSHAPEPEPHQKSEDIPIIEEDHIQPQSNENIEEPKIPPFQGDTTDEIDIKDIPF